LCRSASASFAPVSFASGRPNDCSRFIGEASGSLSDEFKQAHPGVAWREVTALRILLAHHYHRIDPDQVWEIATVSVPDLLRELSG